MKEPMGLGAPCDPVRLQDVDGRRRGKASQGQMMKGVGCQAKGLAANALKLESLRAPQGNRSVQGNITGWEDCRGGGGGGDWLGGKSIGSCKMVEAHVGRSGEDGEWVRNTAEVESKGDRWAYRPAREEVNGMVPVTS